MNYVTQLCNWTSAHLCLFCRAYLHYKLIRVETCSQLINAIDKFLNKYAISVSLEKPVELQYVFWLMIKSNFEQCLYYVNTCISCNGSKKKSNLSIFQENTKNSYSFLPLVKNQEPNIQIISLPWLLQFHVIPFHLTNDTCLN